MREALIVAVGGALGSLLRHALGSSMARSAPAGFPWGTLLINVIGSFAIGVLLGLSESRVGLSPELRLMLVTGVLGGFTTFSAFSWEMLALLRGGQPAHAFGYVVCSVVLGLAAVWSGHALTRG